MEATTLVNHTPTAIAIGILSLSQIAILVPRRTLSLEGDPSIEGHQHAENDQKRSGNKAQVAVRLKTKPKHSPRRPEPIRWYSQLVMSSKPRCHSQSECGCDDTDVGHVTYLAVDWSRSVNINQVEDRGQKGGHTSKGVKLPRSLFSPKRQDGWGERI